MRIAFVVHDYNQIGGHSRYVAEHVSRLSVRHEVHVFANRFEGSLPAGVVPHHVPALRPTALTTILSFAPAATLAARSRFDIIHAQGFSIRRADVITAHISNARWLAARREFAGAALPAHERLFGAVVTPLERRALVDPRVSVIAVSQALADDIAREYGRTAPVHVIHHGVDAAQFNPAVRIQHRADVRRELGLAEDAVAFLYVGDLRKGFGPSLRALAHVPDARLIAVSRSDRRVAAADAEAAGVGDRVHVVPPTSAVERYYGAADAFVLPTPYDAFGMVITEAMACGLPVITTPHAGASELIVPDVHGYLVPEADDVDALAAAMWRLAASVDTRARLGEAAAALMTAHTWDAVVRRTEDVYAGHLDRRRS